MTTLNQGKRLVPEPQGINSKAQSTTQRTRAQTSGGSRLHYHTDETVREEILKVVFKRFEDRYQEKKKWFNYFPQFLKGVLLFASLKQNLTHQTVLKMKLNKPYITLSTEPSTQQAANVLLNIETPEVMFEELDSKKNNSDIQSIKPNSNHFTLGLFHPG